MNFLTLIALFSIVAAARADMTNEAAIQALRAASGECAAATGATEADIDIMIKHLPAQNMETKCLRACIMKKFGLMNADGKFDKSIALKMSELHTQGNSERIKIAESVTNACEIIGVPDDHCEAAEMYKMCLQSEAKKLGVDIMD